MERRTNPFGDVAPRAAPMEHQWIMKHYKAPWSPLLVSLSTLLTAVCLGNAFAEFRHGGAESWVGWLLVALVVGCALFTIRGYTVTPDAIVMLRYPNRMVAISPAAPEDFVHDLALARA